MFPAHFFLGARRVKICSASSSHSGDRQITFRRPAFPLGSATLGKDSLQLCAIHFLQTEL
jgi:hypothetical protein